METLELPERRPKRPLRGKGKKFGVGAADRGVWQSCGRGWWWCWGGVVTPFSLPCSLPLCFRSVSPKWPHSLSNVPQQTVLLSGLFNGSWCFYPSWGSAHPLHWFSSPHTGTQGAETCWDEEYISQPAVATQNSRGVARRWEVLSSCPAL